MSNNKADRQKLAQDYDYYKKEIKKLKNQQEETKKKLISKMEQRNLEKELHDNGMTVTIVRSHQKVTDKQAIADALDIDLQAYEQILEDCSSYEPKNPYITVS